MPSLSGWPPFRTRSPGTGPVSSPPPARGQVAAQRQIDKCAEQCATFAGLADRPGFFTGLAASAERSGALGDDLTRGAAVAQDAYREFGGFLTGTLRARAPEKDAVGRERYAWPPASSSARQSISTRPTPGAGRSSCPSRPSCARWPSGSPRGRHPAARRPAAGCRPALPGRRPRRVRQAWMQDLSDRAVDELGRTHFEIAGPMRRLECLIAPPGGRCRRLLHAGPSADFCRPGRMWWSVEQGRETFSTWRETTVVYHEGVPGHHLQIATQTYQTDRPQRLPAADGRDVRPCRGLGAVRRAAGARTRLPGRRRRPARHARLPAVPRGQGGRRHRHAPGAARSRPVPDSTRASAGRRSWGWSSC